VGATAVAGTDAARCMPRGSGVTAPAGPGFATADDAASYESRLTGKEKALLLQQP
jgi:hypothetical protein